MIWKLAIWLLFIIAHAVRDWYIIEKLKQIPVYWQSFALIRIPAGIIWLLFWPWHNWLYAINYVLFETTSFYLFFPALLNIFRKRHIFYLGKNSGKIDPYFIKHPVQFRVALLLALILCIFSVIVIYQR